MAKRRHRKNSKKRRNIKGTVLVALGFVIVAVFTVLSLTVFFNINSIKIKGETRYTNSQILKATGLKKGDNMFLISDKKLLEDAAHSLPYIEEIKVKRVLPDKLELTVKDAEPDYAFKVKDGYLITSNNRALEVTDKVDENVALVNCKLKEYELGEQIELSDNKELFNKIADAIESTKLEKITYIDFSNSSKIVLKYDNRLTLELGSIDDLETKFKKAKQIIPTVEKDNGESVEGIIKLQFTDSYFEQTFKDSSSVAQSKQNKQESTSNASKNQ